ncbi:alpha-acetolactate decarboxylase [Vibrio vulnificus]|nr:alpha-acetolactate decarboxylase [Vibrio vulnificus]
MAYGASDVCVLCAFSTVLLDFRTKSIMSNYTSEIQRLVNTALAELAGEHQSGKLVDAPIANNHFLVRWVTKALKGQRFDRCVVADLTRWQKAGRSKGNDAALLPTFQRISAFYASFFAQEGAPKAITDKQIEAFLDEMENAGWEVSTSDPIVGCGKVQIFTEGQNSLALCAQQCENCFDGELLVKPMSWFVRGHHAGFVEKASAAGFMVHKVTDYKSNVKYHGEYLVFPSNLGNQLAEIPLSFTC